MYWHLHKDGFRRNKERKKEKKTHKIEHTIIHLNEKPNIVTALTTSAYLVKLF